MCSKISSNVSKCIFEPSKYASNLTVVVEAAYSVGLLDVMAGETK